MAYSTCYMYEKNLKTLPFKKKAPFGVKSAKSRLTVTGTVSSSPTEFEINIWDGCASGTLHFQMHQRWNEDRTVFNNYQRNAYTDWGWPEYAHFPSLKPGSNFTITISTVQEDPRKKVFHFKVRVNDDPVFLFRYREIDDPASAEIELKSPNNDISVSLIKLDYAYN